MRSVYVVLRREYLYRVRNRWFIIGTFALPAFFVGFIAITAIAEGRRANRDREIPIVDQTNVLYDLVAGRLDSGFEPERVAATAEALEEVAGRAREGSISGYLVLDDETLASGRATFHGKTAPRALSRIRMQQAVVRSALEVRLRAAGSGAEVEDLLSGGAIDFETVSDEAPEEGAREAGVAAGFAAAMILYFVILLYGAMVMRSVLEEKTSRVVEVVLSSLRPWELMLGKILGVGAVGLTQIAIWALTAALGLTVGLPFLIAFRPELANVRELLQYLPAVGGLVLFLAFFILGYLLFSSLYAAVAAMCSTMEEAQQTQLPVTMLVVLPIFFISSIMEDPNSTLSTVLSLVPFFSPILMLPRYLGGAPLWQAGLSLVLIAVTTVGVAWVAGRIYRVGILMQGKRPTLPELWRWVKEA
ncbi:MAG: ABC transporter permease [Gemmatimonadota bacterium]|nr:MAG: ABC transporter permease [Gemmatimonadota bacterium]